MKKGKVKKLEKAMELVQSSINLFQQAIDAENAGNAAAAMQLYNQGIAELGARLYRLDVCVDAQSFRT